MRTQNPGSTPFDESSLATDPEKEPIREDVAQPDNPTPNQPSPQVEEIGKEQLSIRKRLLNWRTLVPLVIVVALLIYTSQKLQINPGETWGAIRGANVVLFLAAFLAYYLSFPLRTLRWRLLLENVGYQQKNGIHLPHFGKLLEIVYTSWFANAIVPAKLGDLYRAYLLRQEMGVSVTRTVGTVLAERLLDLTVLLILFVSAIIISLHQNLPDFLKAGLYVTLGLVVCGIAALVMLRSFRQQIRGFIPRRFQTYYDHLHEGTLGSFQRVPLLAGLTVSVWICEAGRFFFIALSLNLIDGSLLHIGAAAIFIALGEALLSTVPFTSGGIGLVEGG
ncbi:MAG TPA: lysylphosphatidylglycerol synthase transmembrane domain-containing protein, partial [Ktedonobacteraceae bacterium]|nr:lysylphosphatidylglycerol synthase transmembrane domain-containing protein [Ktedonobacteraceae bacterium]